jgi:hypothetical protein
MIALPDLRRRAPASLIPPSRLQLSEWIEGNIRLPPTVTALLEASNSFGVHTRAATRLPIIVPDRRHARRQASATLSRFPTVTICVRLSAT